MNDARKYDEPTAEDDVSIWHGKHEPLTKRGGPEPVQPEQAAQDGMNALALMSLMTKNKRLEEEIELLKKNDPGQVHTLRNANGLLKRSLAAANMERDTLRDKLQSVILEFQDFKAHIPSSGGITTPVIDEISKGLSSAEYESPKVTIEEHDTSENTPADEAMMACIDARHTLRSVMTVVKRRGESTNWEALEAEVEDVLEHLNNHLGVEVVEASISDKLLKARAEAETRRGPAATVEQKPTSPLKERVIGLARDLVSAELQRPSEDFEERAEHISPSYFGSASEERFDVENLRNNIAQSISSLITRHGRAKAFACVVEELRKAKLNGIEDGDDINDQVRGEAVRWSVRLADHHAQVLYKALEHYSTKEEVREYDRRGKTSFDGFILYLIAKDVIQLQLSQPTAPAPEDSIDKDAELVLSPTPEQVSQELKRRSNLCLEIPEGPVKSSPEMTFDAFASEERDPKWYEDSASRLTIGSDMTVKVTVDALEDIHGMLAAARTFYISKQVQHPDLKKMCHYLAEVIKRMKQSEEVTDQAGHVVSKPVRKEDRAVKSAKVFEQAYGGEKPPQDEQEAPKVFHKVSDQTALVTVKFLKDVQRVMNRVSLREGGRVSNVLDRIMLIIMKGGVLGHPHNPDGTEPIDRLARYVPEGVPVRETEEGQSLIERTLTSDFLKETRNLLVQLVDLTTPGQVKRKWPSEMAVNLCAGEHITKINTLIDSLEVHKDVRSPDSADAMFADPTDGNVKKYLLDEVNRLQDENEKLLIENQALVVQPDRAVRKAFELEIDKLHKTMTAHSNAQFSDGTKVVFWEHPDGQIFVVNHPGTSESELTRVLTEEIKRQNKVIDMTSNHNEKLKHHIERLLGQNAQSQTLEFLHEIRDVMRLVLNGDGVSTPRETINRVTDMVKVINTAIGEKQQSGQLPPPEEDFPINDMDEPLPPVRTPRTDIPLDVQLTRFREQNDFLRQQNGELRRANNTAIADSQALQREILKYKLKIGTPPGLSLELLHEVRNVMVQLKKGYPITSTRNQQATKTVALLDGAIRALENYPEPTRPPAITEVIRHRSGADLTHPSLQTPKDKIDLEAEHAPKYSTEPIDPDGWFCPLLKMDGTVRVTLKFLEDTNRILGKLVAEHDPLVDAGLHLQAAIKDLLNKADSVEDVAFYGELDLAPPVPGHPDNPVGFNDVPAFVAGLDTPPQSVEEWEKWVRDSASYAGSDVGDITYPLFGLTSEAGEISKEVLRWFRQTGKVKAVGSEMPVSLQKKIVKEAYDCMHHLKFILSALDKSFLDVVQIGYKKLLARERAGDVMNHTRRMSDSIVGKQITLPREIVKLTWTVARSYGGDLPANRKVTSEDWVSEFPDKEFTFYVKEEHGLKLVLDPAQSRIGNRINGDLYIKRRDFYPNFKEVEEEDE